MSEEELRPGYYRDACGVWHEERREAPDRRYLRKEFHHRDRRTMYRRKADLEFLERDHKQMINDALDDFAAEHDGKV